MPCRAVLQAHVAAMPRACWLPSPLPPSHPSLCPLRFRPLTPPSALSPDDPMTTCRKIVNWRTYLRFPPEAEAALTPAARDFISRLLCDVEERLGSHGGASELRGHPFFAGVDWRGLYAARPPYRPAVEHELDTQVGGGCVYAYGEQRGGGRLSQLGCTTSGLASQPCPELLPITPHPHAHTHTNRTSSSTRTTAAAARAPAAPAPAPSPTQTSSATRTRAGTPCTARRVRQGQGDCCGAGQSARCRRAPLYASTRRAPPCPPCPTHSQAAREPAAAGACAAQHQPARGVVRPAGQHRVVCYVTGRPAIVFPPFLYPLPPHCFLRKRDPVYTTALPHQRYASARRTIPSSTAGAAGPGSAWKYSACRACRAVSRWSGLYCSSPATRSRASAGTPGSAAPRSPGACSWKSSLPQSGSSRTPGGWVCVKARWVVGVGGAQASHVPHPLSAPGHRSSLMLPSRPLISASWAMSLVPGSSGRPPSSSASTQPALHRSTAGP